MYYKITVNSICWNKQEIPYKIILVEIVKLHNKKIANCNIKFKKCVNKQIRVISILFMIRNSTLWKTNALYDSNLDYISSQFSVSFNKQYVKLYTCKNIYYY